MDMNVNFNMQTIPNKTDKHCSKVDGLKSASLKLITIACCVYVAACKTIGAPPSTDPALLLLESVANEVRTITQQVSEIQQTNEPIYRELIPSDSRLLAKVNVLDYVGSPANLLQKLAARIGYSYLELGSYTFENRHRATPFAISIVIRAKEQTVLNIIRDVAAQVGNGIVVSVSERQQEITLEYL
jgi:hypothetical protein